MEMVTLWLLVATLAQSALPMSVYLISFHKAPRDPAEQTLSALLSGRQDRGRRSTDGFGGFGNLDTSSWFPWQSDDGASQLGSNTDFSPPDFAGFGGKKNSKGHHHHHHGGGGGKGSGRAEASLGPFFTTSLKDVPNETRRKFNEPEEKSTQARREKYGLNRVFSTPPHAYRIVEEIPFFDTLDHKTLVLKLENFRGENTIPLHKLKSNRPFFPFFIKD